MSPELLLTLLFTLQGQAPLLTDKTCGSVEAVLALSDELEIKARCSDRGAGRDVRLSVIPVAAGDRLEELTLGFCGEILGAAAPTGWAASVVQRKAAFGSPAMVQWRLVGPQVASNGAPSRIDDFTVTLTPGWRQALAFTYRLAGLGTAAGGSPHDCGEWRK